MSDQLQEILVHVGHGKTGSSYVQSAIAASRPALAAAGIAYPIDDAKARLASAGVISSGNLRYAPGALASVIHKGEGAERLLISSESLFSLMLRNAEAFLAEAKAAAPGAKVRMLLYIRDPLDHAVSCYHQDVKRAGFTGSFAENLTDYNMPSKVGQVLSTLHGLRVPVTVRNYSRHSKALLGTFEDWLDLARGTLSAPPFDQVNRSLTLAEIELQKLFNRHFGPDARKYVSDPLCNLLPAIRSETPPVSEANLKRFLTKMKKMTSHDVFSSAIPAEEAYHLGTFAEHASRFVGTEDEQPLTFSRAQLAVVVDAVHAELAKVAVLRKMIDRQRKHK